MWCRRRLAGLFSDIGKSPAKAPQGETTAAPSATRTQCETEAAEESAEDEAKRRPAQVETVTTPAAQEVACMVQEAGIASVLVVDDVRIVIKSDTSEVPYVLRALAWSKLSEEEQSVVMDTACWYREALELPSRLSFSSKLCTSLCENRDGLMYQPVLNADSEDRLRYHMQRNEDGEVVHLRGPDMHAGSSWKGCGLYTGCDQYVGVQAILKDQLPTHASAACKEMLS